MGDSPDIKKIAHAFTEHMADNGQIIESGWLLFVDTLKLKDAPPVQLIEMRRAFFCGASHVFFSIISFLEEGVDPTEKDLDRMTKLHDELQGFQKEMEVLSKGSN